MSGRPFHELRDTGLLWLINTTVFHPRGYALSITLDDDGVATGWGLLGDGTERWAYSETLEADLDALFVLTKELLP